MIRLTTKGKKVYGNIELFLKEIIEHGKFDGVKLKLMYEVKDTNRVYMYSVPIASNPTEIKALLDMGLISLNK